MYSCLFTYSGYWSLFTYRDYWSLKMVILTTFLSAILQVCLHVSDVYTNGSHMAGNQCHVSSSWMITKTVAQSKWSWKSLLYNMFFYVLWCCILWIHRQWAVYAFVFNDLYLLFPEVLVCFSTIVYKLSFY